MNQWYRNRFLLIVLAEVLALSAIVVAFMSKHLSGRGLGIAGLLNMAVFLVLFLLFFRKAQEKVAADDALLPPTDAAKAQTQRLQGQIKSCKRLMAMFTVFFFYGEFVNWDSPPWIRIFGAFFDLGFIALSYQSMRRSQAKLKLLGEAQ